MAIMKVSIHVVLSDESDKRPIYAIMPSIRSCYNDFYIDLAIFFKRIFYNWTNCQCDARLFLLRQGSLCYA